MIFSEHFVLTVNELKYDSSLSPGFEGLKSCLIWEDERALLVGDDYDFLCDLWITRGFIHRSLPREQWGLGPAHFEEVWAHALKGVPLWPGFRRMTLSAEDRAYLEGCLSSDPF
jgi:hypothetical protein